MNDPLPTVDYDADFAWCDARWLALDQNSEHVCAVHVPGHTEHRCCCGSTYVLPPAGGRA